MTYPGNRPVSVEELLAEPLIRCVMEADRVSEAELRRLLAGKQIEVGLVKPNVRIAPARPYPAAPG